MHILESEIKGYKQLKKKAERILTECQEITCFPKFDKTTGVNLGKEYAEIYVAYQEFEFSILISGKMSEKNYIFAVGILEGQISERLKEIQRVAKNYPALKSKLEEFMIAKNEVTQYLLSIMD